MEKKLEMLKALESHYVSIMDRRALNINTLMEKSDSESLDLLIDNIQNYAHIMAQFNFVQKLKENVLESAKQPEKDKNES